MGRKMNWDRLKDDRKLEANRKNNFYGGNFKPAPTEAEMKDILRRLKKSYPHGKLWSKHGLVRFYVGREYYYVNRNREIVKG